MSASNTPEVELRVDALTVERGGRVVISALSFAAVAGRATILSGSNGAGKTTLLRAVAGFIVPFAGSIVLVGGRADATLPEQLHFVGHQNAVKARLTVRENLQFWASCLGNPSAGPHADMIGQALEEKIRTGQALLPTEP